MKWKKSAEECSSYLIDKSLLLRNGGDCAQLYYCHWFLLLVAAFAISIVAGILRLLPYIHDDKMSWVYFFSFSIEIILVLYVCWHEVKYYFYTSIAIGSNEIHLELIRPKLLEFGIYNPLRYFCGTKRYFRNLDLKHVNGVKYLPVPVLGFLECGTLVIDVVAEKKPINIRFLSRGKEAANLIKRLKYDDTKRF